MKKRKNFGDSWAMGKFQFLLIFFCFLQQTTMATWRIKDIYMHLVVRDLHVE